MITDWPKQGSGMGPPLEQVQRILRVNKREVAAILGMPASEIHAADGWPTQSRERWEELANLAQRIEETFEPDSIETWLHAPSRDLHWRVPIEVVSAGRLDEVDAALEALDSGVYV